MRKELKPCPFCGEEARIRVEPCTKGVVFFAECGNRFCNVHPKVCACTSDVAAKIWNHRAEVKDDADAD